MNIRQDIKELKTGPAELRKFGLVVGAVFAALGLFFLFTGKAFYLWCLVPGVLLITSGLVIPKALKPVYLAWMTLAFILGFIVSHLILLLFFMFVITPTGLLARLFGKDFLRLKIDRNAATYWISRPASPRTRDSYERQF